MILFGGVIRLVKVDKIRCSKYFNIRSKKMVRDGKFFKGRIGDINGRI